MASFHYDLTTTAPPEQALAYLGDLTHLPEHVDEITHVERAGDRYEVALDRLLMPDMVFDYVVATTGSTVTATGTSSAMDVVDTWTVTPSESGSGSDVAYVGTYELKGATKLVGPLAALFGKGRAPGLAKSLRARLDALAPTGAART